MSFMTSLEPTGEEEAAKSDLSLVRNPSGLGDSMRNGTGRRRTLVVVLLQGLPGRRGGQLGVVAHGVSARARSADNPERRPARGVPAAAAGSEETTEAAPLNAFNPGLLEGTCTDGTAVTRGILLGPAVHPLHLHYVCRMLLLSARSVHLWQPLPLQPQVRSSLLSDRSRADGRTASAPGSASLEKRARLATATRTRCRGECGGPAVAD